MISNNFKSSLFPEHYPMVLLDYSFTLVESLFASRVFPSSFL